LIGEQEPEDSNGPYLKDINDQSDNIVLLKIENNKRSRKLKCICVSLILLVLLAAAIIYVLVFNRFWEKKDGGKVSSSDPTYPSESIDTKYSWSAGNCGSKKLLNVTVTTQFDSNTTSESCVLKSGESPFVILPYRSKEAFYNDTKSSRPIYIDEIEQDSNLKTKVLEYLNKALSDRGVSKSTKYGLLNAWADST
jgi:hypothetical protein